MSTWAVPGGMEGEDVSRFVCPDCDGAVRVSSRGRETLLAEGCVFRGAVVNAGAFAP